MSHLSLRLLGSPDVHHGGQTVLFPTRKALALLVYLAVESGPHTREKLAALFWPDSDTEHSRATLRRTLAYLRDVLGDLAQPGAVPHLIVERDALGFAAADSQLDLHVVQTAWMLARTASPVSDQSTGERRRLIAQFQAALNLYRGDFLDGFSLGDASDFDDWASMQREAWHRRVNLIFDRLSHLQWEGGDVIGTLETTARWIRHYPLDEAAHRRRMLALFASGDRTAALQAYEKCRSILTAELNADPAPETEALAERLRVEPPPAADLNPSKATLHWTTGLRMLAQPRLIGRLDEHTQLVMASRSARRGQAQLVALEGEPGSGTTHLAREFLRWAAAQGIDVLQGQAFAHGGRLPYQPLIDALRERLAHEPDPRALIGDVWLAELSRLLPELIDRLPDLPLSLVRGEAEARTRLFEAVARLLQALARRKLVIVFIDDLHWADAATLDVVQYLARRAAESGVPMLLLFTLDMRELEQSPALTEWLQELGRMLPLSQIRLGPLTPEDARRVVQSLIQVDAGDALSHWIATETGGHPRHIIETLEVLITQGLLVQDEDGHWVPTDVLAREGGQAGLPREVQAATRLHLSAVHVTDGPASRRIHQHYTTRLPAPPTSLIGRARDVTAVRQLLSRDAVRLLTLIGPPGIGKTRLSLQVATELLADFEDGVCFVALATICDPGLVVSTVAHALGVAEAPNQSFLERLKDYLSDRHMLLVLDNFEQVAATAPVLGELLLAAPRLKVLVTSRSVLHIYGEHEFVVPPLALPSWTSFNEGIQTGFPSLDELAQIASIELFVQRAQAAKADFVLTEGNAPVVAEICTRLDGLPLAIELAAARIKLLAPEALLARLHAIPFGSGTQLNPARLGLLTGGARDLPARQQTLHAAIAWSFDLLDADEQRLFARLGVFVGGWSVEAAEAVCRVQEHKGAEIDAPSALEGLHSLVDKSLVQRADQVACGGYAEPRYMLLETIREYALERLAASGELDAVRRRHACYFLALVEAAAPTFEGAERSEQGMWLHRLDVEHDNVRAALAWSCTAADGAEVGLRLAGALWQFWWIRGFFSEGREWLNQTLARVVAEPTMVRARALNAAGFLAANQGDYATAWAFHEQSLTISRALEDKQTMADALLGLGNVTWSQSNYQQGGTWFEESLALFREIGDTGGVAWALDGLGNVARQQGDHCRAKAYLEQSLALFTEIGYKRGIGWTLNNLAELNQQQGNYSRAKVLAEKGLLLQREAGDKHGIATALNTLGLVARYLGDYVTAQTCYEESLTLRRELGDRVGIAEVLEGLAGMAGMQRRPRRAACLFGAAEGLRAAIGAPLPPSNRPDYTQGVTAVRDQLDGAAFAAAWATGTAMSWEQAVAEAFTHKRLSR